MHSALVRVQTVFGFFTTVAFAIAAFIAISVVLYPQEPTATVALRNIQVVKGRPHYYSAKKEEYAHIKFDLDADLSSLFNWNTKQLFVYVLATYPSLVPTSCPPSSAVIWDLIIPSPSQLHPLSPLDFLFSKNTALPPSLRKAKNVRPQEKEEVLPGVIKLKNMTPKYQITDISGRLAERGNVTLEVGWNVQPWVGALTWTRGKRSGWGRWKGIRNGVSEGFTMPGLKGKKVEGMAEN